MLLPTSAVNSSKLYIDDCFPPKHPLHKIFNRNTLKLSYSCMPNIHKIISGHNKSVLSKNGSTHATVTSSTDKSPKQCNCRNKTACPLSGKCLTPSVVYQATITREDSNRIETYVGHTEGEFKTRFNYHTSSSKLSKYKHATELSKYICMALEGVKGQVFVNFENNEAMQELLQQNETL